MAGLEKSYFFDFGSRKSTTLMKTILLVEDEDVLRELLRELLEFKGYRVLEARNGQDAIMVSDEHKGAIDLLLTDVVMPKMSGNDLAEALRKDCPLLKIIFMSGYTGDQSLTLLETMGSRDVGFLQKPFRMKLLEEMVREMLKISG